MKRSSRWSSISSSIGLAVLAMAALQARATPSARLVPAPRFELPGEIDSNNPAVWSLIEGVQRLFVISSWGGTPVRFSGTALATLRTDGPVDFSTHPGHGVWIEAIVPDDRGVWYAWYHHERSADLCGRSDRQLPRIGALRSSDHGQTWDDLGIVLDAPAGSEACDSTNRFVLGGIGDVSVALDAESKDLYLYYSQYVRSGPAQGVVAARMAWADRDEPVGKLTVWNDGAWMPDGLGTPLWPTRQPFHDRSPATDLFWGPAIHWNTYVEQYVMLLNRAKDDQFGQEGIYVSFSPTLDPNAWSLPIRIQSGGGWYPQVIGTEAGTGTDRTAGRQARFFITGRSERFIEFDR